ncbi:MAG: hypothetical protein KM310_10605 [Clostridiales bacterium]|nr:hypothetical protein [Clostridiales bacterium]
MAVMVKRAEDGSVVSRVVAKSFDQIQIWPQRIIDKWLDEEVVVWIAEMTGGVESIRVIRVQSTPHDVFVLVETEYFDGERFRAWLRPGETPDDVQWFAEPADGWDTVGLA